VCPDCRQSYAPFDNGCSIYLKYELVNSVMAYCNVSQFIAKKFIKSKNICSRDQVEKVFKSSAYLAWENNDFLSNFGTSEISSTPSVIIGKTKNPPKRRFKSNRKTSTAASDSDQAHSSDFIDITLIPASNNWDNDNISTHHLTSSVRPFNDYGLLSEKEADPRTTCS